MSYVNFWDLNFRSFRIPKTCCESNFCLPCQVTGCLIAAVMCLYLITDFQWDLGPKARFSFFWLEVGAIEPDIIENKRGENEKTQKYKQLYNFKSKRNTNKQQESRSSIHIYCITSLFPQQKWWCIYYTIGTFSIRSTNKPSPTGTFSSWWCLHHGEHLAKLGRGSEAKQRRRPLRPPREVLHCFFFFCLGFLGVLKCV